MNDLPMNSTGGPVRRDAFQTVMKLAVPAAFESLFLGLVDLVDTKMVADLGIAAVAAVGLTSQPKRILLMAILALNVAATVVISQLTGKGDAKAAEGAMGQFLLLSLIISTALYVPGFLFARPLLLVCGAQDDTIGPSMVYFRILVIGQFIQALSLTINACQRGSGNTKVTMVTNVTANLVNLAGNYLLIYGSFGFPRLGVAGAALAAAAGSLAAFALSLYTVTLKRDSLLHLHLGSEAVRLKKTDWRAIRPIISSAFSEQLFQRIGMILYVRIVAGLGTAAFGTYQICMEIANFEGYTFDGFAVAATTLVGQALGRGDSGEAEYYGRYVTRLSLWGGVLLGVPTMLFGHQIISVFDQSPEVIRMGGNALVIIGAAALVSAGAGAYAGALRGAGDTKVVAVWTMWSTMAFRPAAAWILCYVFHLELAGVWLAFLAAYTIRCGALGCYFSKGIWKTKGLVKREEL